MLTKADDYPIHQTPEPMAFAGSNPNFYDRYWFNGYSREGDLYFGVALGVYPFRRIMDAHFSVSVDGVQHNLHASRAMGIERTDTHAGPITINVVEPLKVLEVVIADNDHGITGKLTFTGRVKALAEPRFQLRRGPRLAWDYTRMTQNGTWSGEINVKGKKIEVKPESVFGTRDRSWGIRPIGNLAGEPMAHPSDLQFFWMWAPINYDDKVSYFATNENKDGTPWHRSGLVMAIDDDDPQQAESIKAAYEFKSGTRHVKSATIDYVMPGGDEYSVHLEPQYNFYMAGLGYSNPDWGHAVYQGENVVGYDEYELDKLDESQWQFMHVQAVVKATLTNPDNSTKNGYGILEQTVLGPHVPTGFKDILDMAP